MFGFVLLATTTTTTIRNIQTGLYMAVLQILKNIKGAIDARVSVTHSATILANAVMHAGTSIDTFLRENLEWLSRATNWAKFSATAGLGVIHRGQLQQGELLLCWDGRVFAMYRLFCVWIDVFLQRTGCFVFGSTCVCNVLTLHASRFPRAAVSTAQIY